MAAPVTAWSVTPLCVVETGVAVRSRFAIRRIPAQHHTRRPRIIGDQEASKWS